MAKSVAQTREDIATRIGGLRRDRGAATLAGKKFDHAVLTAAESELEALDDADGERVRLERATAT